ncbi:MAG: hydrogenase maturation protease [Ardenticatenaceae bacterium]|nr:hydrogenase maturation protease [Ardenticatenaceae bacterium]
MPKTLVLALGNVLRGDDGVGTAVLQSLQAAPAIPAGVELLDGGTPGLETALLLEGYNRVIIIDAAEMGLVPGEWRRFLPGEGRLPARDAHLRGTMHYAGLAEALALGEALGILPPHIVVYGIQPQALDWQEGLSGRVQTAVPPVAAAILQELHSLPPDNSLA